MAYLVLFVADPAADHHADALRDVARAVPGAGFFDDPAGGAQRTVGTYARVDRLDDSVARLLVDRSAAASAHLAVRMEVQFRERIVGHLDSGVPDAALARALGWA